MALARAHGQLTFAPLQESRGFGLGAESACVH